MFNLITLANAVQPGNSGLFPWLSAIAVNFGEYKFESLDFEYKTQAPTSTAGTVMLAFDPNVDDLTVNVKSKTILMQYQGAVRCAPWQDVTLRCSHADLSNARNDWRYVLDFSKSIAPGVIADDPKSYCVGQIFVATQGDPVASNAVGELYVRYRVRLRKPLNVAVNSLSTYSQALSAQQFSANVTGVSPSTTSFFGASPTIAFGGPSFLGASENTLTFLNAGSWLVDVISHGTGIGTPTYAASTVAGSGTAYAITAGPTSDNLLSLLVTVSAPGQTLVFNASGDTTLTSSLCRVAPYTLSLA
jgi:hypothetical protein